MERGREMGKLCTYILLKMPIRQTESQGGRKEEEGVGDGKAIVLLDGNKIVICGVYWFASYPLSF